MSEKIQALQASMKLSTKRRKKEKSKLAVVAERRKRRSKHLFRRRFERKKAHSNQPTVWTTTEKYADFGMRWKRLYVLCSRLGHQARGPTLALLRSLPQRCHFNSVCHQVLRKFIGEFIALFTYFPGGFPVCWIMSLFVYGITVYLLIKKKLEFWQKKITKQKTKFGTIYLPNM